MDDMSYYTIEYHKMIHPSRMEVTESHMQLASLEKLWLSYSAVPRYDQSAYPFPLRYEIPEIAKPVTFDPTFDTTFDDLCDLRALELIHHAKNTNRPIYVSYSGGIDSTLIVCAILKWLPDDMKDQLYIVLNTESIYENMVFFNDHLKDLNLVSAYKLWGDTKLLEQGIVVTGRSLDIMFGYNISLYHGVHNLPYETNQKVLQDIMNDGYFSFKYDLIVKDIEKNCPIPINTIYEFLWWVSFNTQYNIGYLSPFLYNYAFRMAGFSAEKIHDILNNRMVTFFAPPEFQMWCMVNMGSTEMFVDTVQSHKRALKQYIEDYTGNECAQIKVNSGMVFSSYPRTSMVAIDNNYVSMSYNDPKTIELMVIALTDLRL